MKKLALLLLIASIGCNKKESPKPYTPAPNTYASGKVRVIINSNHKYPFVRIDKDKSVLKYINRSIPEYKDSTEFSYEFTATKGRYFIYGLYAKNGLDSTLFMKNDSIIWGSMEVMVNNTRVFYDKEIITTGTTQHAVDNTYEFFIY